MATAYEKYLEAKSASKTDYQRFLESKKTAPPALPDTGLRTYRTPAPTSTTRIDPDYINKVSPEAYPVGPGPLGGLTEKVNTALGLERKPGDFLGNLVKGVHGVATMPAMAIEDPVGMITGIPKFAWEGIKNVVEGTALGQIVPGMVSPEKEKAAQEHLTEYPLETAMGVALPAQMLAPALRFGTSRAVNRPPVKAKTPRVEADVAPEVAPTPSVTAAKPKAVKAQEAAPAEAVKQPWEMTRAEQSAVAIELGRLYVNGLRPSNKLQKYGKPPAVPVGESAGTKPSVPAKPPVGAEAKPPAAATPSEKAVEPHPAVKAALKEPDISPFYKKLDDLETAAWERVKKRQSGTTASMGGFEHLPDAADITLIGAIKIAKGTVKFAEWSAEMVKDFGEQVKPHLRKLYSVAQKQFKDELEIHKEQINLDRMNVSPFAKTKISEGVKAIQDELADIKGEGPLSNAEVIEAAKGSELLRKVSTREQTLESEAAALRARQNLAALAEQSGTGLTPDFVEALKVVSADATRKGRELQALGIEADPSLGNIKAKIVKKLLDMGKSVDEIVKAAEGVDFNNAAQVTDFYRKYVPPKLTEWIDEYRYINLLSSPKTHIVNAFSNLLQAAVVRPATRLVSGGVDNVASALTKRQQEYYVRQVPAYYRGMVNSLGDATKGALDVFKGKSLIERPDIAHIPTGSKILKPFEFVPRALEAGDIFFQTLIRGGELEALARGQKLGAKPLSEAKIGQKAKETGAYTIFRAEVDAANKSGQGHVLAGIDKMTQAVYSLRRVPGVKWFVPFVRTPMNIFKQGIEYSPLGYTTIFGSKFKIEQFSKATIGSTVVAGAAVLGLQGRLTWAVPTRKDEKDTFYASGRQAYAVKIGDAWVSYSRLGPLAYPLAMAAAFQYHTNESPYALSDSDMQKATRVFTGIAQYFSDQSYMEGIGDLVKTVKGDPGALTATAANVPSQLIPLSSLQRWVANIIDPVFRKSESGFDPQTIIDNLKRGIPGFSQDLEPYKTAAGEPSRRPMPMVNALSPVQVNRGDRAGDEDYQRAIRESESEITERRIKELRKEGKLDEANALREKLNRRRR
jgi:hypothetical protein